MKKFLLFIFLVTFFQSIFLHGMLTKKRIKQTKGCIKSANKKNEITKYEHDLLIWKRIQEFEVEDQIANRVFCALVCKKDEEIKDDEFMKKIIQIQQKKDKEIEIEIEKEKKCLQRKKDFCKIGAGCCGGCIGGFIAGSSLVGLIFTMIWIS